MEIRELRIGNWVKIKDEFNDFDLPLETTEFKIKGFNDGSVHGKDVHILFWYIKNKIFGTTCAGSLTSEVEPIPLTEEWLLKVGLNFNNTFGFSSNKICVFNNLKRVNIHYDKFSCDYEFVCPKYVHQLQNLYFALTGEELEIKEEAENLTE